MAVLADNFKFYLTLPDASEVEVHPVNDTFQVSTSKGTDDRFLRKNVKTVWRFRGDDYETLLAIEQSADRCEKLPFRIVYDPAGGSPENIWTGYISLNDGKFNEYFQKIDVAARTEDDYTCLTENWDTEVNLLDGTPRQTVKILPGTIETASCSMVYYPSGIFLSSPSSFAPTACIGGSITDGWTLKEVYFTNLGDDGSGVTYEGNVSAVWAREVAVSATMPPGNGWVNIGGSNWARQVTLSYNEAASDTTNITPGGIYTLYWDIVGQEVTEMDNGVALADALEALSVCDLVIRSNFFSIDPDGSNPTNDAYTNAATDLAGIVIFDKSDVKRAGAFNNATRTVTTLKKFIASLQGFLPVYPVIRAGELWIEHVSYFENQPTGLDLTAVAYAKYIEGKEQYEYLKDSIPPKETFAWMEATDERFDGNPITYSGACVGEETTPTAHVATDVTTNIAEVLLNPDKFSDDGYVFVATQDFNGDTVIMQAENAYSGGDSLVNGQLSFPYLQATYWLHDRPLPTGMVNGVLTTFESVRRLKKQETLTVGNFDATKFLALDINELVETQLGEGEIESASWDAKTSILTLNLIF